MIVPGQRLPRFVMLASRAATSMLDTSSLTTGDWAEKQSTGLRLE